MTKLAKLAKLAKLLLLVAVLVVGVGPAAAHRRAFPHARPLSADFVVALQPKHGSINKLLASLAVKPRYRFESRALRGFAASLRFRETQRLLQDPDVDCVCPDNWSWIVDYAPVVAYPDVARRTSELVTKYGFTTTTATTTDSPPSSREPSCTALPRSPTFRASNRTATPPGPPIGLTMCPERPSEVEGVGLRLHE